MESAWALWIWHCGSWMWCSFVLETCIIFSPEIFFPMGFLRLFDGLGLMPLLGTKLVLLLINFYSSIVAGYCARLLPSPGLHGNVRVEMYHSPLWLLRLLAIHCTGGYSLKDSFLSSILTRACPGWSGSLAGSWTPQARSPGTVWDGTARGLTPFATSLIIWYMHLISRQ